MRQPNAAINAEQMLVHAWLRICNLAVVFGVWLQSAFPKTALARMSASGLGTDAAAVDRASSQAPRVMAHLAALEREVTLAMLKTSIA
jgi:hypothetical protein